MVQVCDRFNEVLPLALQADAVGGCVFPQLALADVLPEDGGVDGVAGLGADLLHALALLAGGGDQAGAHGVSGETGLDAGAEGGAGDGDAAAVGGEPVGAEGADLVDGNERGAGRAAGG